MMMSAMPAFTFGESGGHLRRCICGIQIDIPFLFDFLSQQIQREILFPKILTDTYRFADAGAAVVDSVFFRIADNFHDKRRHTNNGIGLNAANSIPLQFRNAVAYPDNTAPKRRIPKK